VQTEITPGRMALVLIPVPAIILGSVVIVGAALLISNWMSKR
jgi:hypothetical protein